MRGQCRLQARVRSYVLDSDGSPQVSDLEFHFPTTTANGEKKKKSFEIHGNPSCILGNVLYLLLILIAEYV